MNKPDNQAKTTTVHEQIKQLVNCSNSTPTTDRWAEIERLAQHGIAQRGRALTSEELTSAIEQLVTA